MPISTAVSAARVARVLGILAIFQDLRGGSAVFLPPRIAVLGQGNTASTYASAKVTLSNGAAEAASLYGFGSPIHAAVQRLLPVTGDGVGSTPITIYPLQDGTTPAEKTITPSGVPTEDFVASVKLGGRQSQNIAIPAGSTVAQMVTLIFAGINGTLDMPMLATDDTTEVTCTAKWGGLSGNDITAEITGGATAGTSFVIADTVAGAGDPIPADITTILSEMGNVWDNVLVNCLTWTNTAALDAIKAHGDGRWGALVHAPYVALTATPEAVAATLIAAGDLRKDDRINSTISVPGALDMPWEYAARAAVRITGRMDSNPASDYANLQLSGLRTGLDSEQFDTDQRDLLVKAGISTVEVVAQSYEMSDTVTYYHPDDEPIPGYRYVVDLVKIFNTIFNIRLEFIKEEWDGAPLLNDDDPTKNPRAKKPKMAKAALASIVDGLAFEAILTKPATIKAGIEAGINATNPKRLDMKLTVLLSGNVNIRSVDLNFGFSFS
jgi:phage tail sheath gpL-like